MEAALTRSAQGGDALFAGDDPFSPPAPPVAALKAKVASKLHAYAATRPAPGATTRPNVPAVLVYYMMWGATQTDPDTDAGGIVCTVLYVLLGFAVVVTNVATTKADKSRKSTASMTNVRDGTILSCGRPSPIALTASPSQPSSMRRSSQCTVV